MQVTASKSVLGCLVAAVSLLMGVEAGAAPAPKPAGAKREAVSVRLPSAAFAAMETINPEHILRHVRYLSHDLLEGRGTGQRGGDIAAEYIATQFAEYGLKPAGDNGTYLQKVPLVGITTLAETQFTLAPTAAALATEPSFCNTARPNTRCCLLRIRWLPFDWRASFFICGA